MLDAVMAMTTTNTEREAKSLATLLVKEGIAACVQIVPKILSVYVWQKEIREDQEYLLLIKTQEKRIRDVKAAVEKHHSYEVPELLVVPVIDGAEEYLNWLAEATR